MNDFVYIREAFSSSFFLKRLLHRITVLFLALHPGHQGMLRLSQRGYRYRKGGRIIRESQKLQGAKGWKT